MKHNKDRRDHWFHEAKKQGWRSRAAFKLKQIDEKRNLLKKKMIVLDLGAAPGSWMQFASSKVGPKGKVIGIDLKTITPGLPPNTFSIVGDFKTHSLLELTKKAGIPNLPFDIVLSDMAPSTTGHAETDHFRSAELVEKVLQKIPQLLKKEGSSIIKIFEGERSQELSKIAKKQFESVKLIKPTSSKSESREIFFICEKLLYTHTHTNKHESQKMPPLSTSWKN